MVNDSKKTFSPVRQRSYLAKDQAAFKKELLSYAKTFYQDKVRDLSDNSLPGMFIDMMSGFGDHMSFYLDHMFEEFQPLNASESQNIENHINLARVPITGASPAVGTVQFVIEVPSEKIGTVYQPVTELLPIIIQGTICTSNDGIKFELVEDVDFRKFQDPNIVGSVIKIGTVAADGNPSSFLISMNGQVLSGFTRTEDFVVPNEFIPFRELTLSSANVTEILSVIDSEQNRYFEVEYHTHDVVFTDAVNLRADNDIVKKSLQIQAAPYRFVKKTDLNSRSTTLVFGGGSAESTDTDIIPDPSKFAIPLYGKQSFSRFEIDPNALLGTNTLGVSPQGTTIKVKYRYGGGLSHNVASETIKTVTTLYMQFPAQPEASIASRIRETLSVNNQEPARGGENAPTVQELQAQIPASKNAQSRIASPQDLLARVYTLPSSFGRVFRAAVDSKENNLFIVSRDAQGRLVQSPDTLKLNLETYLNEFRFASDSINILDARVINVQIYFEIATDPIANKNLVVQSVNSKLKNFFDVENWQINQPIRLSDVKNIVYNTEGVVSVIALNVKNVNGIVGGRTYNNNFFDVSNNTAKDFVIPPPGGIFSVLYPNQDIYGQGE